MATIRRFEDLELWQVARKLTAAVYALTRASQFSKDWGLADQAQRASVSVMTNVAEGFDCESNLEFVRFLGYAGRSASEIQSLFYAALDQVYVTKSQFDNIYRQAESTRRMAISFSKYLRAHHRAPSSTTRQPANSATRNPQPATRQP